MSYYDPESEMYDHYFAPNKGGEKTMPVKKKIEEKEIVELDDTRTPPALIERAIESGASVVVMERLLVLQQRWEEGQAKKAYASAIADLRPDLPEIIKNRSVDFTTDKGRTHYRYEDLQ